MNRLEPAKLIHIASEVVVIAGVVFYFSRENTKLKARLLQQEETTQEQFSRLHGIIEQLARDHEQTKYLLHQLRNESTTRVGTSQTVKKAPVVDITYTSAYKSDSDYEDELKEEMHELSMPIKVERAEPVERVKPVERSEPIERVERVEPIEPVERVEPVELLTFSDLKTGDDL